MAIVDGSVNQFFKEYDESDGDALILSLIAQKEEHERRKKRRCGSVYRRHVVHRDIHGGNLRIVVGYFADIPVHNENFQEKNAERAFGVLHSRFAMVRGPCRTWDNETISYVMTVAVILHNMIIENNE